MNKFHWLGRIWLKRNERLICVWMVSNVLTVEAFLWWNRLQAVDKEYEELLGEMSHTVKDRTGWAEHMSASIPLKTSTHLGNMDKPTGILSRINYHQFPFPT